MANRKSKSTARARRRRSTKVGSDPDAIRSVGGKGDFGAAVNNQPERDHVSRETKSHDPGARQPRSGSFEGDRTAGVGGNASGPGSSSGGDIDPDIIGVGTDGSAISQSGPDDRTEGADISSDPIAKFNAGADTTKLAAARGDHSDVGGPVRLRTDRRGNLKSGS